MTTLRLGVPSKGRLQIDTIAWFAARGIHLIPAAGGREYAGRIDGIDGVSLVLLSAGEIPRELASGRIDLGVTGRDLIHEKLPGWADQVRELAQPGFGYADLILAVPRRWIDVNTVDDLDAVAAAFRVEHGQRLRIATKYHALTRAFLTSHGVADYQLVDSQGATEGTIRNGTAEAIADITTSGETLCANHLKILSDGEILKSEAVVYVTRAAERDPQTSELLKAFEARLAAGPSLNA